MTYAEPILCQVDVRKVVSLRFECAYAGYVSGPEALLFSVRTTKSIKLKEDALPIHGLTFPMTRGAVLPSEVLPTLIEVTCRARGEGVQWSPLLHP